MSQDRIGTEIAGYRIRSMLGRGGMSVVYLATQAFPARNVALKLLAPELAGESGFRERFIRESNAAASLDHPNVIPIYGAGEADGVLWIAMRYVEGTDLAHLIRDGGPVPPDRTVRIIDQVASALDAAHEIGLVHRDVKPGNILLARSDHAYITDFGITKRRDAGTEFTKTGDFLGSVDYAAPEQIRGEAVDARADVYSLGCVTYECLTGEPPFAREAEVAVLYAHLNDPPPRPGAVRPELPPSLDEVVRRAMAKDPAERYGSAGELAASARQALPVPSTPAPPSTAAPRTKARARRRAPMLAGAGTLAFVVAVGVALLVTRGGTTSPPGTPTPHGSVTPSASTGGAGLSGFDGVAEIDPSTGRVARAGKLVLPPNFFVRQIGRPLIATEGAVWVTDVSGDIGLVKLDPKTGAVEGRVHIPVQAFFSLIPASASTSLWVLVVGGAWAGGEDLFRVDPATDHVVAHLAVDSFRPGATRERSSVAGIATGREGIWIVNQDGSLVEIDAGTNRVSRRAKVGPAGSGLALSDGAVWVSDNLGGAVYRYDIASGRVKTIHLPGGADAIAADDQGVWVLDRTSGTVVVIDPTSDTVSAPIRVGAQPTSITLGDGAVWVTDPTNGELWRVDEVSRQVTSYPIATNPGPGWASVGEGGVWVSVG
jgi:YVTN family beta-propeller protein